MQQISKWRDVWFMSVSKVQNIVTHVSSLQTQQTLVADHFMVPQALEILCQLPWHQTGTRSQRQVKFRLRWDSSEGEVKSGVWDTNTHLRVTEDRKITFCFVCFFFDTVKATDPCHTDTTWHKNKHTHTHTKKYIFILLKAFPLSNAWILRLSTQLLLKIWSTKFTQV